MSEYLNKAVQNNTVQNILRLLERYPDAKNKLEVVTSYSAEQLEELLKAKRITDELLDCIASEKDEKIIRRIIKLTNHGYTLTPKIISFSKDEEKTQLLCETDHMIYIYHSHDFSGCTIDQMKEISIAFGKSISEDRIKKYMLHLSTEQMVQMRYALCAHMGTEFLEYMKSLAMSGMSGSKLRQIRKAYTDDDLSIREINLFAREKFSAKQMESIRKVFQYGEEKASYLINSGFDEVKMELVQNAFEAGLSLEEVKTCVSYDNRSCRDRLKEIELEKLSQII